LRGLNSTNIGAFTTHHYCSCDKTLFYIILLSRHLAFNKNPFPVSINLEAHVVFAYPGNWKEEFFFFGGGVSDFEDGQRARRGGDGDKIMYTEQ
jgi:hypothetical protein